MYSIAVCVCVSTGHLEEGLGHRCVTVAVATPLEETMATVDGRHPHDETGPAIATATTIGTVIVVATETVIERGREIGRETERGGIGRGRGRGREGRDVREEGLCQQVLVGLHHANQSQCYYIF